MIYKTLHTKLMIEKHELWCSTGESSTCYTSNTCRVSSFQSFKM